MLISLHHHDTSKLFLLCACVREHQALDWELQIEAESGLRVLADILTNRQIVSCVIHTPALLNLTNLYFNDRNYSLHLHCG